jgi:hypothetical protein
MRLALTDMGGMVVNADVQCIRTCARLSLSVSMCVRARKGSDRSPKASRKAARSADASNRRERESKTQLGAAKYKRGLDT